MEISIVGLTKNDFASCLDTLEDIGTRAERVLLLREPDNTDPCAIAAYLHGRQLGYVSAAMAPLCQCAFAGELSLSVPVLRFEPKPHRHVVCRLNIETGQKMCEGQDILKEWVYTGPLMRRPPELRRLLAAEEHLRAVMEGKAEWQADSADFLAQYVDTGLYDISYEGCTFRLSLLCWLSETHHEQEHTALAMAMADTVTDDYFKRLTEWLVYLTQCRDYIFTPGKPDYAAINSELQDLGSLLDAFLSDKTAYARRLYYMRLSRHSLRRLLSALSLYTTATRPGLLAGSAGGRGMSIGTLNNYGGSVNDIH